MTSTPRDWTQETPDEEIYYELTMWRHEENAQDLHLTRREFIALKARLAELRGLPFTDEEFTDEECEPQGEGGTA